ncbi:UNVERIFIED_CONTAM: hypothetical protein FKN15_017327 [Acipenser sinensis]
MSSGNAKIGKPAPHFEAIAVVDGQFKDIKLSDYRDSAENSDPHKPEQLFLNSL